MIRRWLRSGSGRFIYGIAAALAVFFLLTLLGPGFFPVMERGVLDGLFRLRDRSLDRKEYNPYVSDRARVVGFDEASIAAIGKWPWKRYVHAKFLRNLQLFSPRRVMIDLLFINPEEAPPYLMDRLPDSAMQEQVSSTFTDMDRELSGVLAQKDNVYLDVELMERSRDDISDEYFARIVRNEEALRRSAMDIPGKTNAIFFKSLEPLLDEYLLHARPGLINVMEDPDGKIREWPVYYGYVWTNGASYLPSVLLSLIKDLYYATGSNLSVRGATVLIRNARVPVLDPVTRKTLTEVWKPADIEARLVSTNMPAGYNFDANLYHCLSYSDRPGLGASNEPYFCSVPVLERADGKLELLGGWEIWKAAQDSGKKPVRVSVHHERDMEVPIVHAGLLYVNFGGQEGKVQTDINTGRQSLRYRIPTETYQTLYTIPDIPPIPELDGAGSISTNADRKALETWFIEYCAVKTQEILTDAGYELRERAGDEKALLEFIRKDQAGRKFFFYSEFLQRNQAEPGGLNELYGRYEAFGKYMGQDPAYHLSDRQLLAALLEFYRQQYEKYHDQVVFVGGTCKDIGDIKQTPSGAMFGIQVIANAFNTVATGNILHKTSDMSGVDKILLLVLCVTMGVIYAFLNIRVAWVVLLITLVGIFYSCRYSFESYNLIVTMTPLLFGNGFTYFGVQMFKIITEERDKKFLQKTFGTYLAPEIIAQMYKTRGTPALGGESKRATAYFTDIAGFSTFSEKLSAKHLLELLNEYLSVMTDILISEQGTLDKYIGDAIVAFIGAPTDVPDHALRGCRIGLRMQAALEELRQKWAGEKLQPGEEDRNFKKLPPEQWIPGDKWPKIVHQMRMRIGINTGELVVGNMGSQLRMNYTMMGDTVNLAARLEAAAKQYGVYLLANEPVLDETFKDDAGQTKRVRDVISTRFLDRVVVMGRTDPVDIFELIAMKAETAEKDQQLIHAFNYGMAHYLAMEWDKAIEAFERSQALERFPAGNINPSLLMIERCREFKLNPPAVVGGKWDGVYRLTRK